MLIIWWILVYLQPYQNNLWITGTHLLGMSLLGTIHEPFVQYHGRVSENASFDQTSCNVYWIYGYTWEHPWDHCKKDDIMKNLRKCIFIYLKIENKPNM